jgi:hypothetical protein
MVGPGGGNVGPGDRPRLWRRTRGWASGYFVYPSSLFAAMAHELE